MNIPPHLKYVATLPGKICMLENWRQSEIYIMINDKPQGSIVKHFSCDGLLHYKFITFLLVKEVVKSVNIRRSYTFGTLHFCHQRCRTHQASINTFLFSNFCTEDSRIIIDLTYRQWLKWGVLGGLSPPASTLAPLLESEPSLPTAGPKLLNSIKNHNVRCRINKF